MHLRFFPSLDGAHSFHGGFHRGSPERGLGTCAVGRSPIVFLPPPRRTELGEENRAVDLTWQEAKQFNS